MVQEYEAYNASHGAVMKPDRIFAIVVMCLTLSGCAPVSRPDPVPPDRCWSDLDQLGERTRFYPNVDENQALNAAERLLRLAGRDDMKIERSGHSLAAEFHRERRFYLFLVAHSATVWDHWIVATRPEADGIRVCAQVRGQTFTDTFVFGAEPVTNAVYPTKAIERDPGKRFKPPAHAYPVDYDTFWARLDFLLGRNPVWASCPSNGSGVIRNNTIRGRKELNPLCHTQVDDPSPPDAGSQ
jgi:hypothetical protein